MDLLLQRNQYRRNKGEMTTVALAPPRRQGKPAAAGSLLQDMLSQDLQRYILAFLIALPKTSSSSSSSSSSFKVTNKTLQSKNSIEIFDRFGRLLTTQERQLLAKQRGLCFGCGRKTHQRTSRFGRLRPITTEYVENGICLPCWSRHHHRYNNNHDVFSDEIFSVRRHKYHCSLVCRRWHKMVQELVQSYNTPHPSLVTPAQLSQLKRNLACSQHVPDSVHESFIRTLQGSGTAGKGGLRTLLNETRQQQLQDRQEQQQQQQQQQQQRNYHIDRRSSRQRALHVIVRHFANGDYQKFSQLVEQEYRKFLLVRRVENLVAERYKNNQGNNEPRLLVVEQQQDADNLSAWCQPCHPNELVDLFWQVHMGQDTQVYQSYCQELVGQVIARPANKDDQETPCARAPSDMDRKAVVFRFENQVSPVDNELNECPLFQPTFNPYKVIGEMRRRQRRWTPGGFE